MEYGVKDKEKLEDGLLRLSKLEQDYLHSWAAGTRTEYENRIKHDLFTKLTKFIITIAGIISIIASLLGGAALFVSLPDMVSIAVDAVVPIKVENEFKKTADKRLNRIQEAFKTENEKLVLVYQWQNYHDLGHMLRKYLDVFIKIDSSRHEKNNSEHQVEHEFNQKLIILFYKDAIRQFTDAIDLNLKVE